MTDERPEPGIAQEISSGLRRILAPNASAMTHWGTNSYLIGTTEVAVIDPGPDDPAHLEAILRAVAGARVAAILISHAHLDHSAGAARLARRTGAPVLGFGPATAGRSARMAGLAGHPALGGGEGLDAGFAPDRALADGDRISVDGSEVEVLHTPGHFAGHLSFALDGVMFSGDLVMGWSTTLISPPDGDVAAFMASCRRLAARSETLYLPGHGAPIEEPAERIGWLLRHRQDREAQISGALADGPATPEELAARIYSDIPRHFLPAAARNVLAHLIDLADRGLVRADGPPGPGTRFSGE